MLKRANTLRGWAVPLAAFFCLLALARIAQPLESTTLQTRPSVAPRYQKLTRHAVEEVGSRVTDISMRRAWTLSHFVPDVPRAQPQADWDSVQIWPCGLKIVHRRMLPASPDDTH